MEASKIQRQDEKESESTQKLSSQELAEIAMYYQRRCIKCGATYDGRECKSCYCPICLKAWQESNAAPK